MRRIILFGLFFAAALAAGAPPAAAYHHHHHHHWYGWSNPPSYYRQGPSGRYETPSDFSASVYGVPCDYECTLRAQRRWGTESPDPYGTYFHVPAWWWFD